MIVFSFFFPLTRRHRRASHLVHAAGSERGGLAGADGDGGADGGSESGHRERELCVFRSKRCCARGINDINTGLER